MDSLDCDSSKVSSTGRRHFLKAAGASAALTVSLAGCTDSNSERSQESSSVGDTSPVTLNIWMGSITEGKGKKDYINKVVTTFEKEHNVEINVQGVPFEDINTKLQAAQAAGNQPHLIETNANPTALGQGSFRDIGDLLKSSKTADLVSESIIEMHRTWGTQATAEKGNILTWPIGFRPYLSCWRDDWISQAGIDPSAVNYEAGSLDYFEDLEPIYRKLQQTKLGQQDGYFPSATGMKQSDCEYLAHYIGQFGGSKSGVVNDKGTKATINEPPAIEAISMQFEFLEKGLFDSNSINYGDEESTTAQWAGKVAENHIQDSTDLWADYLEEQPKAMKNGEFHWGVPFQKERKHSLAWLPSLGFVDGVGWNQKSLDMAAKFLDTWTTDPKWSKGNATDLGWVPVNSKAIREREFFGETEMHERFWRGAALKTLEEFEFGSVPAVPGGSAISFDIPRKMYQRIHQGTSVKEAADKAAEEINSVLAKHGRR